MSPRHSAPTLLRLFENYKRAANILVDDWEDLDGRAQFTIPADHPRAGWLMHSATTNDITILVLSTDDIEWMIQTVHHDCRTTFYEVTLTSRRRKLAETQPDDDLCIEVFGVEE